MQERQIETPVRDKYEAMQQQTTRGFAKIPHILMFVLAVIASYVIAHTAFNPLMNAWDRFTTDPVETARIDKVWQQIMDAKAGTILELADHSLCMLRQPFTHENFLDIACRNVAFVPEVISQVIGVYPVHSKEWDERAPIFFKDQPS